MWIVFALLASLFWGLTYTLNEQLYRHISFVTSLAVALTVAGLCSAVVAVYMGTFGKDMVTIFSSPKVFWLCLAGVAALLIAEVFIGLSIVSKNATLAGLIEISYPLFILLFSYLLFKENNFTVATAVGGALMFSGVAVIYLFNK